MDARTDYLDDLSCSDLCAAPRAVGLTGPVPLHLAVARPRSLPYAVSEPRFETSLDLMGVADDMWVPSMVGIQNSALMGTGICTAAAAVFQRRWGAASAAFDVSSLGVTLSQQAPSPLVASHLATDRAVDLLSLDSKRLAKQNLYDWIARKQFPGHRISG